MPYMRICVFVCVVLFISSFALCPFIDRTGGVYNVSVEYCSRPAYCCENCAYWSTMITVR